MRFVFGFFLIADDDSSERRRTWRGLKSVFVVESTAVAAVSRSAAGVLCIWGKVEERGDEEEGSGC